MNNTQCICIVVLLRRSSRMKMLSRTLTAGAPTPPADKSFGKSCRNGCGTSASNWVIVSIRPLCGRPHLLRPKLHKRALLHWRNLLGKARAAHFRRIPLIQTHPRFLNRRAILFWQILLNRGVTLSSMGHQSGHGQRGRASLLEETSNRNLTARCAVPQISHSIHKNAEQNAMAPCAWCMPLALVIAGRVSGVCSV